MAESKFIDLDLEFTAHPVTGDIARKFDEEAVKRSIRQLVLTDFFERRFRPEIGSGVHGSLFDQFTPLTSITIQQRIQDVIRKYEPRAKIISVVVSGKPESRNLDVTIKFTFMNQQSASTIKLVLQRLR